MIGERTSTKPIWRPASYGQVRHRCIIRICKLRFCLANDDSRMDRFIREKYERKKYCATRPPALREFALNSSDGTSKVQVT